MFGILLKLFVVGGLFLGFLGVLALLGHADRWYIALGLSVATYAIGAFAIKRLLFKLFTSPFKAKGAVLEGAQLEIHAMKPAPAMVLVAAGSQENDEPGEVDDADDPDGGSRRRPDWRYFEVDATVTPSGRSRTPFQHWAPGELQVVPIDRITAPTPERDEENDDDIATIEKIEVFGSDEQRFIPDEGMSYAGPQRLRFILGIAPTVPVAKIQYYFEGFGRIEFPRS